MLGKKIVEAKEDWIDLAPYWDEINQLGEERHKQKLKYKSTKLWNSNSHIIGLCGEFAISIVSGEKVDKELRIQGQKDSADFNSANVEVKCSTFWKDPHLKHPVKETRWPKYFVLVALNLNAKKAKVIGWTTNDELKKAKVCNYGYGDQYSLSPKELKRGLPPTL